MKTSIFLAVSGALLALAGPVAKRVVVVETEYVWVTDFVTEEDHPKTQFKVAGAHKYATTTTTSTTSTSTTTTSTSTSTSTPEPVPTTSEAPVAPAPSPDPVPSPEPSPEPAVFAAPSPSPSPSPVPVSSPPVGDDVANAGLWAHNQIRANHSAPAMTWSDELAGYAHNTGNACKFAHDMDQGAGHYGQNLFMLGASSLTWTGAQAVEHAVQAWYNEEKSFEPYYGQENPGGSFSAYGHYTQAVWQGSTTLGCYPAFCGKGTVYDDMDAVIVICNYQPQGNVGGGYAQNVKPPIGLPPLVLDS